MNNMLATLKTRFGKKDTGADMALAENSSYAVSAPVSTLFLHFSTKEQVSFAKRLAFLMKAGVGILESMVIIRNQTKSKRKQKVFDTIIADVSAGQYLSKSLARYPDLFGEFTINIIKVGETAGVLPDNLTYLADELSKKYTLERKVRGALIYPAFITVATFGVTGMLIVYIFPKIMPIFISLNVTLPLTTRALLAMSEFLSKWGFLTIGALIVSILLFEVVRRTTPSLRYAVDWLIIRLPVAGHITKAYNCANFTRTLGINIKSGVTLSEAMSITAEVTRNSVYKRAYQDFTAHVLKGEKISSTMSKYPNIFPDMLPHLILIGETTGSLSNTLSYLSDLYEAEVEDSTKNLSNSIEPILLMTMGILVGIIAISVIAPIYEVTKHIGNAR